MLAVVLIDGWRSWIGKFRLIWSYLYLLDSFMVFRLMYWIGCSYCHDEWMYLSIYLSWVWFVYLVLWGWSIMDWKISAGVVFSLLDLDYDGLSMNALGWMLILSWRMNASIYLSIYRELDLYLLLVELDAPFWSWSTTIIFMVDLDPYPYNYLSTHSLTTTIFQYISVAVSKRLAVRPHAVNHRVLRWWYRLWWKRNVYHMVIQKHVIVKFNVKQHVW